MSIHLTKEQQEKISIYLTKEQQEAVDNIQQIVVETEKLKRDENPEYAKSCKYIAEGYAPQDIQVEFKNGKIQEATFNGTNLGRLSLIKQNSDDVLYPISKGDDFAQYLNKYQDFYLRFGCHSSIYTRSKHPDYKKWKYFAHICDKEGNNVKPEIVDFGDEYND